MSKKSKKIEGGGLVYSTDKETMAGLFSGLSLGQDKGTKKNEAGKKYDDQVRVWLDRKKRGGKEVSLIKGIKMPDSRLKEIAKTIKSKCGVGGSAKDGEIIIQGNHRDKIVDLLKEMGYVQTKKAGG